LKVNLQELFKSKTEVKPTKDNKVVSGEVSNNTSTLELYKNRKSYKEQVNDQNLPIGQKNKDDKNLNNQLDMWYKRKTYLRYDEENRLIVSSVGSDELIEIASGFSLIDFVADAANNFFNEYNVQRNGHPKSKLNNIKIVRAYEKRKPYDAHINEVYVQFFNEVLDPIKNTNKIKTFDDFLNLFYAWFIDKNIPITETGYYESENYNIYNTGFAFDYIKATTQEDKINIINDVRFPVVNYVAKTNGLRIDPNNPNRLIADIYSAPMLNKYVSKNFENIKEIDNLPAAVYKKYFETINFSSNSIFGKETGTDPVAIITFSA